MTAIRNDHEIRLLILHNPHRWDSPNRDRFTRIKTLIRTLGRNPTVGEYVEVHNHDGSLGGTRQAHQYLRYMIDRSQVELPGVEISRRGPRTFRQAAPLLATTASDLTFGVEIECFVPTSRSSHDVVSALAAAGIDCRIEHLSHQVRTWWKIVNDGSLMDYRRGKELVSPPLQGAAGLEQVEKVMNVLRGLGCTVGKKCGFHVHVGTGTNSDNPTYFQRLLRLYAGSEAAIDSMMAPSRRHNTYCGLVRVPRGEFADVGSMLRSIGCDGARSSARYRKLNVDCWWSQRTVEFRQHGGTVEATKAVRWVQFCLQFCAAAASDRALPNGTSLDELLTAIEVGDELRAHFLSRAEEIGRAEARRTLRRAA